MNSSLFLSELMGRNHTGAAVEWALSRLTRAGRIILQDKLAISTPGLWEWWRATPPTGTEAPGHEQQPPPPPVVLAGQGQSPRVLGRLKSPLSHAQYDVVQALLKAGPAGLTKDGLTSNSNHGDAVNILKRLARSDPDWKEVIRLAGKTGGRYRIA
jgi:hypothetical protein